MTPLKQIDILKKEYEYVKKEFQRATEVIGVGRKVKRGECWFPVNVGRSYYSSLNDYTVELTRRTDQDIEHLFEYGKSVCLFTLSADGSISYLPFSGTVSFASSDVMAISLPSVDAYSKLSALDNVGVQLNFDETSFSLMFEALKKVAESKDNRLAHLRDVFHGNIEPEFSAESSAPIKLPWLNGSQEQAVRDVVRTKDVLVVHGPPGTGKTTTLIESISEVLRREPQVMVCAQSNTAVDWISEQLSDRGISVLRIGNPARVTDKMLENTFEKRYESHPEYPTLWAIRRDIRTLRAKHNSERTSSFHQKLSRLRDRADEIDMRIRQSLFDGARVIACTLVGSANKLLFGQKFNTLFIDEAAQALEAACWIALQKANRVILAGDHCQLPPTIKSPEAMRGGLGKTLMETIAQNKPSVVRLLDVQYRMNEELMRFSSEWFYKGRLKAAPEVKNRSLFDELDAPLIWIPTDMDGSDDQPEENGENENMREAFVGLSYGRVNRGEAKLTIKTLCDYIESFGRSRFIEDRVDIGVISPYKAQVQYLRSLLKRNAYLRPLRGQITINTVDAFQGQERDVILISLVRANDDGQIGFLSDLRRMNVAMTRARMKFIIIGSQETLCKHTFYKKLWERCEYLKERDLMFGK
ncbi:MAG: AAA domain-containing protein [Bacteroidales bacterium]|nr:AAA domain-containing protein [Bacteroidales bacterium]